MKIIKKLVVLLSLSVGSCIANTENANIHSMINDGILRTSANNGIRSTVVAVANAANGVANAVANPISTVIRLTESVPLVMSGYFSVNYSKYGCAGESAFQLSPCGMIGHSKFRFQNGQSHWLCACCACRLGIEDPLEAPVLPLVDHGTKAIVTIRNQTFRVMGGSLAWARELIYSGSLSVSQVDLGCDTEFSSKIKAIFGNGVFNTLRAGVNRGSPHLVTERVEWVDRVEDILQDIPAFKQFFKNAESCYGPIVSAWLTLYFGMKFKEHRDKRYRGKPRWRGILNFNERDGHMKVMRIIDRKFGRFVDIACEHGTFIVMDLIASGTLDPRITHAVFDALFNGNITLEMGEVYKW